MLLGPIVFGLEKDERARFTRDAMIKAARENGGSIYLDSLPRQDYETAETFVREGIGSLIHSADGTYLVLNPT